MAGGSRAGDAAGPGKDAMRGGAVVEWAPFQLADGVTEEELLRASADLQVRFLARQRGFVGRELLRGEDGAWVDLVCWRDRHAAEEAIRAAAESPACHAYFQLMRQADHAEPGAGVLQYDRIQSYGSLAAPGSVRGLA